jgi:hypothetical protein
MTAQSKVETGTLAASMALAFAEIEAATKSATNPHFKSKYADLGAVIEAIKPPLIRHGLFFTQRCQPAEDGISVETVLHHCGGEKESLGTLYVPANKRDAQGFGSALTYARRYALQTAFGVPTEDDDGNAAVASAPRAAAASGKVTDEQFRALQAAVDRTGADLARFCKYFNVPSLKDVPASRYQEALGALEAKAKRVAPVREQLEQSVEMAK